MREPKLLSPIFPSNFFFFQGSGIPFTPITIVCTIHNRFLQSLISTTRILFVVIAFFYFIPKRFSNLTTVGQVKS